MRTSLVCCLVLLSACASDAPPQGSCTPAAAAAQRELLKSDGAAGSADAAALQRLYAAAASGEVDALRSALQEGLDVNANTADVELSRRDGYTVVATGGTALILAANAAQFDAVDFLICAGADPNLLTQRGDSALQRAVVRGAQDIVAYLLAYGAQTNPDRPAFTGFTGTALHDAAEQGQLEIAEMLIEAGADVDARVFGDVAPIDMARRGGHDEIVELLRRASKGVASAAQDEPLATNPDAAVVPERVQVPDPSPATPPRQAQDPASESERGKPRAVTLIRKSRQPIQRPGAAEEEALMFDIRDMRDRGDMAQVRAMVDDLVQLQIVNAKAFKAARLEPIPMPKQTRCADYLNLADRIVDDPDEGLMTLRDAYAAYGGGFGSGLMEFGICAGDTFDENLFAEFLDEYCAAQPERTVQDAVLKYTCGTENPDGPGAANEAMR